MRLSLRDNKKKYVKLIPYAWELINHRMKNNKAFDNLRLDCFTAQVGYFWKGSLVDRFYTVSGPIFSIWLNI